MNALDLEIRVLHTIVAAGDHSRRLLDELSEEHFTSPEAGTLFSGIKAMYERRDRVPDFETLLTLPQFENEPAMNHLTGPDAALPGRGPLTTAAQVDDVLHEMEANRAMRDLEEKVGSLLGRLGREGGSMTAEDKLKFIAQFKKETEAISIEGSPELSKPEKIRALLDRAFGNRLSYEVVREKLDITSKELNKLATREEAREQPRFRREKTPNGKYTHYLVLNRGLHMVRMMEKGSIREYRRDAAYLPEVLHDHIATHHRSLGQHACVMAAAWTDGMKSNFLMECAAANARRGKKVLLINNELDDVRTHTALASREAGYRVRDYEECNRIVAETPWIQNIDVMNIRQAVQLDELCDHIKSRRCDVVVWDYLATHFLLTDVQRQASAPATIVQRLGVELVDAGIPLFTAIQTGFGDNEFPVTWLHRATFSLVLRKIERQPDHIRATYKISKNKEGGCGEYLDVFYDVDVLNIVQAKPLTALEWQVRQKHEAQEIRHKAKEYEAGADDDAAPSNGKARKTGALPKARPTFGSLGRGSRRAQAAKSAAP